MKMVLRVFVSIVLLFVVGIITGLIVGLVIPSEGVTLAAGAASAVYMLYGASNVGSVPHSMFMLVYRLFGLE